MPIRVVLRCVVLLACLTAAVQAQKVLVLPGAQSTTSTISVFNAGPLAALTPLNAAPQAFLGFQNAAGTRYLIVTSSSLVVLDAGGAQVQTPLEIANVKGAALSPDGQRLVVVAGDTSSGAVHIFDVSGDTVAEPTVLNGVANPQDVAISLDGTTAYVVTATGVTPVDLGTATLGTAASLDGLAPSGSAKPGVTVGLNGLVYVNASNALYELHPSGLSTVSKIVVAGYPGKPNFLYTATAAAAVNQATGSGIPRAWTFDLNEKRVVATLTNTSVRLDQVFYVSPTRVYAIASTQAGGTGYLYQFKASGAGFAAVKQGATAGILSPEPNGSKYLYVASRNSVTCFELSDETNKTTTTATLATPAGPVFYVAPAVQGHAGSRLKFNDSQTLTPGALSLPLVIRVLDDDGLPMMGGRVSWQSGSIRLRGAMDTTNAQGYATAYAPAPSTNGTYSISASFPGASGLSNVAFSLTVGSGGGGENPPPTGGIRMVTGNGLVGKAGDVITGNTPLTVLVSNAAGAPVAGAKVTFTASPNGGLLVPTETSDCNSTVSGATQECTTDAAGHASVLFQPQVVAAELNQYLVTTVTASIPSSSSSPGGSVVFTEISIPATLPGGGGAANAPPAITNLAPTGSSRTITGAAGATINGAIRVQTSDVTNGSVHFPNVGLWVRTTPAYTPGATSPAVCAGAGGTVLTGSDGIATCNLVLGSQTGTFSIYRIVGGYDALPITLIINEAPPPPPVPTTIDLTSGDGSAASLGQTVNLVGTVRDQTGKTMSNTSVTWTVLAGSVTYVTRNSKTDSSGQAKATVTVGSVGAIQIKLAAGAALNTFRITGSLSVGRVDRISGNSQSVVTGAAFTDPLVVEVHDSTASQGIIAGTPVTFAVSGGATLSATSATTGVDGRASVNVTAGSTPGTVYVTATAGGITTTFTLTVRLPGPVLNAATSFLNGASFQKNFITPGGIATIMAPGLTTGLGLLPGSCLSDGTVDGLPTTGGLPTRIGGVEFQFSTHLAPIFAICKNTDGTEQANVLVPFELAPVKISVAARYNAGTAEKTEFVVNNVDVKNAAPGIFEYLATATTKVAVAVKGDGSVVSPSNAAKPGDTIQVYTTGMGPVLPIAKSNVPGSGQKMYFTPTVKLGGRDIASVTGEYARNGIGIYIVTFQVPSDQEDSESTPLIVGVIKKDNTKAASLASQIPIKK